MRWIPTVMVLGSAALVVGAAGCKSSSYHSDMAAICACPYSVPAGASSAAVRDASQALGQCLKKAAATPQGITLVGAISGEGAASVRGKMLRDSAKEAGLDSCPLADACDKVWADEQKH